jgi:hypothetical protein
MPTLDSQQYIRLIENHLFGGEAVHPLQYICNISNILAILISLWFCSQKHSPNQFLYVALPPPNERSIQTCSKNHKYMCHQQRPFEPHLFPLFE